MSAFIVSKAHLDALVSVALFGVIEKTALSGRWYGTYFNNAPVVTSQANILGEWLRAENYLSIKARYPRDTTEPYTYVFPWGSESKRITAAAALKLLDCYEYQSCEHDGWDTSAVKRWCDSLKNNLITCVPGYDAAPWAID